jgi:hypothetical protein
MRKLHDCGKRHHEDGHRGKGTAQPKLPFFGRRERCEEVIGPRMRNGRHDVTSFASAKMCREASSHMPRPAQADRRWMTIGMVVISVG